MAKRKRPRERVDGSPPSSKYATKLKLVEAGERAPFQFVQEKKPGPPQWPAPLRREPLDPARGRLPEGVRRLSAVVTSVHGTYFFLSAEKGAQIFLRLNILRRSYSEDLEPGDMVDCEIENNPNGKGLRVRRVWEVTPF